MNARMKKLAPVVSLGLVAACSFSACETPGQTALAGAATGAAIGGLIHGRGHDALVGAAVGAGAGYLIGKVAEDRRGYRYEDVDYDDAGYPEARYRRNGPYPVGRPTNRYGFVTSPYPPHNLIDVRGIPRGARVMDPSVNRVFIAP